MRKIQMEVITAHNGAEVIIFHRTEYVHTEFDRIRSEWREQELQKQKQPKIKTLLQRIKRRCA